MGHGKPARGTRPIGLVNVDLVPGSPSACRGSTPVVETARTSAGNIHGLHSRDLEGATLDEIRNIPMQMTTSAPALPDRIDAVLPPAHAGVWREALRSVPAAVSCHGS